MLGGCFLRRSHRSYRYNLSRHSGRPCPKRPTQERQKRGAALARSLIRTVGGEGGGEVSSFRGASATRLPLLPRASQGTWWWQRGVVVCWRGLPRCLARSHTRKQSGGFGKGSRDDRRWWKNGTGAARTLRNQWVCMGVWREEIRSDSGAKAMVGERRGSCAHRGETTKTETESGGGWRYKKTRQERGEHHSSRRGVKSVV